MAIVLLTIILYSLFVFVSFFSSRIFFLDSFSEKLISPFKLPSKWGPGIG